MFDITEVQQMALDTSSAWINSNWSYLLLYVEIALMLGATGYYLWCWVNDDEKETLGNVVNITLISSIVILSGWMVVFPIVHLINWIWIVTPIYAWLAMLTFVLLMFAIRYGRRTHKMLRKHMVDKDAHK